MNAKTVLYAAVGAPVVAARKIGDRVEEIRANLNKEATSFSKTAGRQINAWAGEGQKVVDRITDAKVVDDLTAKVDFDQVSTQVGKLRDQLEDMISTWRTSFRPEKLPTAKVEASGVKFQTVPGKTAKKAASRNGSGRNGTGKKPAGTKTVKATAKKAPAKKAAGTGKAIPAKATEAAVS